MAETLLPLRFRVLKELEEKKMHFQELMTCLHPEYGTEKQFNEAAFLDHVLALKENGLLDEADAYINEQNQLLTTYQINDAGKEMLRKYLPKK
ncbi:hypothetical protein IGL98_001611 [Enterococcus sp. DIV0840]|uniref:Uncharacterized protein n=1 Tax=Enterococcus ureasiticus TaxID=903984 RepID=A0A1E5GLD4_9ENTE|nr:MULTISPECIES: hypothetical protein [Enterococcus]MBO0434950.1 hypothetical protein [Enterococcus sp. DIV0849a]MBO0472871.1 hypothetical protein [Enterococcus ureasiticus]OEG13425.1 hypothetical protein BCR21_00050 [Enterococcus ureasiticus]